MNKDDFLYVERYRPALIEECILPQDIKETFNSFVRAGQMPNLLLSGGAGIGKTTVARALANELNYDVMFINCSEERGIDTLRTKMMGFCSTVSLTDERKCLILDESDYLTPDAQAALRAFIEQFANTCSFVMTCNFKNRLIPPLHSRTTVIDFRIDPKNKPEMLMQFTKRLLNICELEKIEVEDPNILATITNKYFPDFRRVLNEIQRYSIGGKIDTGIIAQVQSLDTVNLITGMREKNFKQVRKWVADNSDSDMAQLFRKLYDSLYPEMEGGSVPQLVLHLGKYQYQSAFVPDQELNLTACMVEIMADCQLK
tara:strand:- start:844 stop:1785 length:942 start_codon:yes stop_codon:yes gene_type:complete